MEFHSFVARFQSRNAFGFSVAECFDFEIQERNPVEVRAPGLVFQTGEGLLTHGHGNMSDKNCQ